MVEETGRKKTQTDVEDGKKKKRRERESARAQCNVTDKVVVTAAVNAKRAQCNLTDSDRQSILLRQAAVIAEICAITSAGNVD